MTKPTEREEFLLVMGQEFPGRGDLAGIVRLLLRLAKTHLRWAETRCNREVNEAEERREERLEQRISELCADLGIRVKFGGDPRGFTVKLFLPSGRYNSFGGKEDGFGVPQ
jgi:hypothetical protein